MPDPSRFIQIRDSKHHACFLRAFHHCGVAGGDIDFARGQFSGKVPECSGHIAQFDLPVIREAKTNCFLGLGKNFLTLFQNQTPGLDHFCIAIEKFSADAVVEEIKCQGLKPNRPSGSDRVYFPDVDGPTVRVSSVDHHA